MLTVADLKKGRERRAAINHETYKMLYSSCIEHIKNKEKAGCGEAVWSVPAFVVGRPPFEHSHAIRYVSEKLRIGKFNVNCNENHGELHVEWASVVLIKKKKKRELKKTANPKKASEPLSVKLARIQKSLGYS
jgi:hypothetical protein